MLSYRHSYHAGNFADVLKHLIQIEILDHFLKKDKPFDYVDTHSGAGMFQLDSAHASKNREYENGIGRLLGAEIPSLARYIELVGSVNGMDELKHYPGSPAIAQHLLRRQDRGWLFELHSTDFALLEQLFLGQRNFRVQQRDGFAGMEAVLPPVSRRGFVLIDPSYEIKDDYQRVVDAVVKAHRKFATGTFALWYPVVERRRISLMEEQFRHSGIRNIELYELGIAPDSDEKGMTSAGMIVINPPWQLREKIGALLPELATLIAPDCADCWRCEVLVEE